MNSEYGFDKGKDLQILTYLLSEFDRILSAIINERYLFKNEQIHNLIIEIWQGEFQGKLLNLAQLVEILQDKDLKAVGLTGKQLQLKLQIFKSFLARDDRFLGLLKQPAIELSKRFISGFFDFFNSLLGSLSDVIPFIESFKEFKDMVHFEIEYGSDNGIGFASLKK